MFVLKGLRGSGACPVVVGQSAYNSWPSVRGWDLLLFLHSGYARLNSECLGSFHAQLAKQVSTDSFWYQTVWDLSSPHWCHSRWSVSLESLWLFQDLRKFLDLLSYHTQVHACKHEMADWWLLFLWTLNTKFTFTTWSVVKSPLAAFHITGIFALDFLTLYPPFYVQGLRIHQSLVGLPVGALFAHTWRCF